MTAKYVQRGESIDYVPYHDVHEGDVVMFGDNDCMVGVAKLGIRAFEEGALALAGVYEFETDDIENWYTLPLLSSVYVLKDGKTVVPYSSFSKRIGRFFGVSEGVGKRGMRLLKP